MTYAFNTREVAEALVHVGNREMARKAVNPSLLGTEIITVKTPVAGIDARVGIDCSSAECNLAYVNKSDELVDDPNVTKVVVYNTTGDDIAGDQYIAATRQRGVWVASVSGGGGGGTTQTTVTVVANSGISAATWPTAGTGTGDIYELSSGGASWSSIGGGSVNVRNPWEETIDSGSVMTCYKEGDYYVVIQASCPSV